MSLDLTTITSQLAEQRWFGDKSRVIESVQVVDHAVISEVDGEDLVLALARITFHEGDPSNYTLLLLRDGNGSVRDATHDISKLGIFGELMAHGQPIKGERGVFHFSGAGLDPSSPPGASVRPIGTEQSNTSIVMDDAVVLKFFRKVEAGPNPDLEITRLLTNEGFDYIPPQVGEIFYEVTSEEGTEEALSYDLGIAQQFAGGCRDGWESVLEDVSRLLDEVHPHDAREDISQLISERAADSLASTEQLGDATGSLHVLLGREEFGPDLLPEEIEAEDLKGWSVGAQQRLDRLTPKVPELAELAERITTRLEYITSLAEAGRKIRVHGDFHLGQVLRSPRSWLILDFEGEPARRLEERRAKQSPVKDVAGMLRSFSYAGYSALLARCQPHDDEWAELEAWTLAWEALARERFLIGYLTASHGGRFLPGERASIGALLDFFELDKALYEVDYEVDNRPDWLRIPLQGIRRVIERGDDGA